MKIKQLNTFCYKVWWKFGQTDPTCWKICQETYNIHPVLTHSDINIWKEWEHNINDFKDTLYTIFSLKKHFSIHWLENSVFSRQFVEV